MTKWKVELWIEEKGVDSEGAPFATCLTQTEMNRVIEKGCTAINEEYENVKVVDFDAYIEPEQTWDIQSESMPNMKYHVKRYVRNGTERFECTCSDYLFRKHECKHIKKVEKQLAGEKQKTKLFPSDHVEHQAEIRRKTGLWIK